MAKKQSTRAAPKKKPAIQDNSRVRDIQSLHVSDSFIYDVEVYKLARNSYNLEDSRFIRGSVALDDNVSIKKGSEFSLRTVRTMVAAPIEWLKDEGYNVSKQ